MNESMLFIATLHTNSKTKRRMSSSTTPPAQTQKSTTPQQHGIDIHEALSILSARSQSSTPGSIEDEGCGCSHADVPESAKSMGQTIDLLGSDGEEKAAMSEEERKAEEQRLQQERATRLEQIRKELDSMSDKELLQTVLKVQQDRVATYREYEKDLSTVLQTGNLTSYPNACSKVTAAFSVLSETVTAVKDVLDLRQHKEYSGLIQQLQQHEKEKLHLTAAHHLERIRQNNHVKQPEQEGDKRIAKLLQEGVQSLQQKITACVETINEVLDEIRCNILEE